MNWVREEIRRHIETDEEFACAYVEDALRRRVAHQIRALRETKEWSQADLGKRMGKPQSNISRLEDPAYGKWSAQTLFSVAHAFRLAPFIDFISYDDFMARTEDLSAEKLSAALRSFPPRAAALGADNTRNALAPEAQKLEARVRAFLCGRVVQPDLGAPSASFGGIPPTADLKALGGVPAKQSRTLLLGGAMERVSL